MAKVSKVELAKIACKVRMGIVDEESNELP